MQNGTNSWEGLIATPSHGRGSGRAGSGAARNGTAGNGMASARRAGSSGRGTLAPLRTEAVRRAPQRIVLFAEAGLFADGLARSLRTLGAGVEVRVASIRDGSDAVSQCALVIVDLDSIGDIQSTVEGLRSRTQAPIVALAHAQNGTLLDTAMRSGAVALLSKTCTEAQLLEQVCSLMRDCHAADASVSSSTKEAARRTVERETRPYGLTPGEMDVLRLLREGLTNAQIARERGSKEGTVKIHLDKIYKKLGVQNRTQAICIASRMDSLIELQARRFEDAEFRFEALSAYVTHEIRREGEVLFAAGDPGDSLYYVQRGRVKLVELGLTMQDGDLFGEIGIFSPGHQRTCTARCDTQVSLFRLSAEKANRLYIENPRFAYHVLRLIAGRLIADRAREATGTLIPGQ